MAVRASDGALQWEASLDLSGMKKQIKEINAMLGTVAEKTKDQSSEIDKFSRNAAKAIATYISVTAISNFVTDIVRVRGEFQQLEVAFTTMLRSKEKADALMAQIVDLAAKTPFGLQEAAKGAKQLLAYGFAADKVKDTLTTLGNVAAGVGAPLGDIVYLYGTLRTQGRAFQKDIMQFTGRGIPIIEELAKQFNTTSDNVSKLVEAGKVGFPEIEKAFQSMTNEGGMFNNLMEAQSKTISGLISNFGDAWATMLNDIGRSQEGPIADIIKGSISVVENYQKVLDVLKVLVVTYGTYRAAVIATAVAQTIAANAAKGWTIAETLRYRAMVLSANAMKILNATMLSNPAVLLATGVSALVTALLIFGKTASQTTDKATLLANAQKDIGDKMADAEKKIRPYVDQLKKANLTETERINIYNKLKEVDAKLVEGLDARTISYDNLTDRVNKYLGVLREQYRLEANEVAIKESIKVEQALQERIDKKLKLQSDYNKKIEELQKRGDKEGAGLAQFSKIEAGTDIKVLQADLEKQKEITKELGEVQVKAETQTQEAKKRTLKVIDDAIKAEKEAQETATNKAEFDAIQKRIDLLQKERETITGKSKASEREENKYEKQLERRAGIISDIANLERSANQTGLLQRQKDLDVINEKYDKQLQSVKDVNEELAKYNAQNPNKQVSLIGNAEVARINAARQIEVNNLLYREDAQAYIDSLNEKKAAFDALEQVQKDGSIEQVEFTKKQYKDQIGEFDNYVSYLKNEAGKLFSDVISGNADLGQIIKFEELTRLIEEAGKKAREAVQQGEVQALNDLLETAKTYDAKRADIEKKYSKLYETLEKQKTKISEKEYKARLKALNDLKKEETDEVGIDALKKTDEWKKFEDGFKDIGRKATRSIIEGLEKLKASIKDNAEAVKLLNDAIKKGQDALSESSVQSFREVAGIVSSIGSELNIELGASLKITAQQISSLINNIGTLFDSNASKTDEVGSIVGIVTSVFTTVRDALLTAEDMAEPLHEQKEAYEEIRGKIEGANYALERQLDLIDELNGVQKLNAQQSFLADLEEQQGNALKSLQEFKIEYIKSSKEIFVDPLFGTETQNSGVWGVFTNLWTAGTVKKKMKYELEVVDTSSFDTIEDFKDLLQEIKENGGKLNGQTVVDDDIKGLELFIQTYDEAVAKQKQLKNELDQIFTATTAGSIADSIIEGFKAGKRTMEDFAGDFEALMKAAVINSLKFQTLEAPLQDFYEQFAKLSASDGLLTSDEIDQLSGIYGDIIKKAGEQFDNLNKITSIDLLGTGDDSNSLKGAIKGMTEQQAELLAGQFGGLRLTALDHLNIARTSLDSLNKIEANTARLIPMYELWRRIEINGIKVV
ncbi:MAG TPA: tape measure protein [Agriterribacter sp.]|uniref:tape measure protein n=1 Tax=Agriterribacter sp. TaxID=2821509 RepID=UPI002C5C44A5|nr:tape measure protein [Agriterribacter sp.]HRQ17701.1 tape measure protein [Agriterribacter sp.]